MMYRLILLNGPEAGQRWSVPSEGATIGRDPACAVRLTDTEAAERHAIVEFQDAVLRIRDLGSMNRILVNRREVREAPLKHGDTIEIGLTRLMVEAHVQAEIGGEVVPRRRARFRSALAAVAVALLLFATWRFALRGPTPRPGPDSAPPVEHVAVPVEAAPEPVAPPPEPDVTPPTPPPAAVAARAPEPEFDPVLNGPDLAPISEEMRRLREDFALLLDAVAERTALQMAEAPPALWIPPPVDPTDRMLEQAREELAAGRTPEADRLLGGLLLIAPDRADARAEHAALFERRGQLKRAMDQWTRIAAGAYAAPLREQAAVEVRRLRALERDRAEAPPGVRLTELKHVKFVTPEDAEELRTVHARILRVPNEPPPDPDDIRLEVTFYERNIATGAVQPSSAVPPQTARLEGPWLDEEPRSLIATYRVPAGARADPEATLEFHGYVARLCVRDRVVEERARPQALAALAVSAPAGVTP